MITMNALQLHKFESKAHYRSATWELFYPEGGSTGLCVLRGVGGKWYVMLAPKVLPDPDQDDQARLVASVLEDSCYASRREALHAIQAAMLVWS